MASLKHLVRFDWFIKFMLRDKSDFAILEGFLSELLKEDVVIQEILESESNQQEPADKFNRVDLLVKNSKGELVIIEVQNEKEIDFLQRLLYGTSKATVEYIKKGIPYTELKKVISISILYFELGQGKDYIYHGTTRFIGIHENDLLILSREQQDFLQKDSIQDIFPEYYLIRTGKFNEIVKDSMDEWIYFFKTASVKSDFKAKGIKQAAAKLDYAKLPLKKRKEYDAFMDNVRENESWALTQRAEAESAKKEGAEEQLFKVVKELIAAGSTNDFINKITKLSLEEILKMKRRLDESTQ